MNFRPFQETIESLKHEVAESRARLHAHSEIERTLRAQLEAARAELADSSTNRSTDTSYRSCNTSDAACDPVCCEVEECELRLKANEELSCDATELAAEVITFILAGNQNNPAGKTLKVLRYPIYT